MNNRLIQIEHGIFDAAGDLSYRGHAPGQCHRGCPSYTALSSESADKPVAWRYRWRDESGPWILTADESVGRLGLNHPIAEIEPLYVAPVKVNLIDCPKCGSRPALHHGLRTFVLCSVCSEDGECFSHTIESVEAASAKAVEAWNRRTLWNRRAALARVINPEAEG